MSEMRFVTPTEFGRRVPWSMATVRRRLRDGSLPAIRPGGPGTNWLIDWEAFQKGETKNEAAPPATTNEANYSAADHKLSGPRPRWMRKSA